MDVLSGSAIAGAPDGVWRAALGLVAALMVCGMAADAGSAADGLPLQPARNVEFRTNEGTWMSVDVAPSGEWLTFDHLGDIYSLPFEGGRANRLVAGMDWAVQPSISPDGKTVVYVSDRGGSMNLWLYDMESGVAEQFTREPVGEQIFFADPEWSADGESIVVWTTRRRNWFYGNLPREIRRYPLSAEGRLFDSLTGAGNSSIEGAESPALSPDGRLLYYARFRQRVSPFYGDRVLPEWQVEVQDLESGVRSLLTQRQGGGFAPALSSDGRYVAYGSRHRADTGIRLLDLERGTDRWLVFPVDRDQQESNFFYNLPAMAFTPDSRELVASFGGNINRISVETGVVREIPFEVDVELELGPLVQPSFEVEQDSLPLRRVRTPLLSPDGSTLAFEALGEIWLKPAAGGEVRRLAGGDGLVRYDPAWSPDGRSFVYCAFSDEQGGHVYRQNAERGEAVRLTRDAANYAAPSIDPRSGAIWVTRIGGTHPEAFAPPYQLLRLSPQGALEQTTPMPFPGRALVRTRGEGPPAVNFGGRLYDAGSAGKWSKKIEVLLARRPHTGAATGLNVAGAETVLPSPDGDEYLAQAGDHVYVIAAEAVGQDGTVVIDEITSNAVVRLSSIGGEFPNWSRDGAAILYSLGGRIYRHDRRPGGDFSGEPAEIIESALARDVYNPRGTFALSNVRIVTMRGDEVIEDGVIVVDGNRIEAVGRSGQVTIPADAEVIDGRGATVVPGFVDTHAHPDTGQEIGARAQQPTMLLGYLAYGVTTIHDPAQSVRDLEYGDLVASGEVTGPRIYGTGPAIHWWRARLGTYEDARRLVARYASGWNTNTIKQYVAGDRRDRQWIVQAAADAGILLTIEAEDFNYNLTHVIDGYGDMAHSIGVAPLYHDVVTLMSQAGTSVQYQFGTLRGEGAPSAMYYFLNLHDPWRDEKLKRYVSPERMQARLSRRLEIHPGEHAFPLMARQAADLMRAGVTVSLGDHGEWGGPGVHWELWAASSGMSNHEALRMATILGARTIGLDGDLGSIEPGKLADFLLIDGNPLERIRETLKLRYVVKNGVIFEAETLTRIWPDRRELDHRPWWRDEQPRERPGATRHGSAPEFEEFFR